MAGAGPTNRDLRNILELAARSKSIPATASELEIFYRLCIGRVLYHSTTGFLYFVDSPVASITEILQAVYKGLNKKPPIQQLYMDRHHMFKAANRLYLDKEESSVVLVALRMRGMTIERIDTDILQA